ncbi:hypothetical protein K432DRAFT_132981 [Lepidopterella palustris CBS 459.81]|uniref:Gcp-like domain-containing protein n=1 Tax=Lepidopterella palustris CBS 459.81 TaxID=1314670 RepID=A0A8E2JC21_9PEZI|nr:hypothetical protein K432DRAFT_132981 [Lepidopterella palustris CBS 459.81]
MATLQHNLKCLRSYRPIVLTGIPRRPFHGSLPTVTLAIETSCDDTCVAVLEKRCQKETNLPRAILHFNKKITSDNSKYGGVHPLASLESHQESLASLIGEAIDHLPDDHHPFTDCHEIHQDRPDTVTFPVNEQRIWKRIWKRRRPDCISVTRGPGMRANLFTGLDMAKGLAVAWQIPLVGVHHMQAHALTPQLVSALQRIDEAKYEEKVALKKQEDPDFFEAIFNDPDYPFLSVLVSGGHTLVVQSTSLTDHAIIASTVDIAIGDCLDKIARTVLPNHLLQGSEGTMYGALLERFAFPHVKEPEKRVDNEVGEAESRAERGKSYPKYKTPYTMEDCTAQQYTKNETAASYDYTLPEMPENGASKRKTKWGWGFTPPLSNSAGGGKTKSLEFSFTGLVSAVDRVVRFPTDAKTGKAIPVEREANEVSIEERRFIAREAMTAAFEHLVSRIILALQQIEAGDPVLAEKMTAVVLSGGVAANGYLRHIVASMLTARGYPNMRIIFPPPSLCTDNAAMIAWAGIEMFQSGHTDELSIRALRKWPLDQLLTPTKGN